VPDHSTTDVPLPRSGDTNLGNALVDRQWTRHDGVPIDALGIANVIESFDHDAAVGQARVSQCATAGTPRVSLRFTIGCHVRRC